MKSPHFSHKCHRHRSMPVAGYSLWWNVHVRSIHTLSLVFLNISIVPPYPVGLFVVDQRDSYLQPENHGKAGLILGKVTTENHVFPKRVSRCPVRNPLLSLSTGWLIGFNNLGLWSSSAILVEPYNPIWCFPSMGVPPYMDDLPIEDGNASLTWPCLDSHWLVGKNDTDLGPLAGEIPVGNHSTMICGWAKKLWKIWVPQLGWWNSQ